MKKNFLILIIFLFSQFLFSQNNNLIFSEYYEYENLKNINIISLDSPIFTEKYAGDSILIEIYGNNNSYKPNISIDNDSLNILFNQDYPLTKGNYILLKIYFPVNFISNKISINSKNADINISYLPDSDFLDINSETGNINLQNLKTSDLSIITTNGNILVSNTICDYFYINSYNDGNIIFYLKNNLLASSYFITKNGNINFYYKKNKSNFDILEYISFSTKNGKIIINDNY